MADRSATDQLSELLSGSTISSSSPSSRFVELPSSPETTTTTTHPTTTSYNTSSFTQASSDPEAAPQIFTQLPILQDSLITKTSVDQSAVAARCLHIHADPLNPLRPLSREQHIEFLSDALTSSLPGGFVSLDASRPWILYWALIGLYTLGEDLDPYRSALIETLRPIQHPNGGFGGGNGQTAHLAVSYASLLALCTVGGREAWDLVDRNGMWRWISGLKQLDGGFRMCTGGEADVRGMYCALTILSLLGLPTELAAEDKARLQSDADAIKSGAKIPGHGSDPSKIPTDLLDGCGEYLSRCQTYEGGIAGAPGGLEAHGGYAFCSLAALCTLGAPHEMIPQHMDLKRLIRWLSERQYAPEGGFSGRTNKLVDGCYSTWVGGCWALVEAALNGPLRSEEAGLGEVKVEGDIKTESLWSREALVRYILGCCQSPYGGLRDKPGKGPDFYHSAYILLGLSSAQNYNFYSPPSLSPPAHQLNTVPRPPPTAAFHWKSTPHLPTGEKVISTCNPIDGEDYLECEADAGAGEVLGEMGDWWNGNRVRRAHPVWNVPFEGVRSWAAWGGVVDLGALGKGGVGDLEEEN